MMINTSWSYMYIFKFYLALPSPHLAQMAPDTSSFLVSLETHVGALYLRAIVQAVSSA